MGKTGIILWASAISLASLVGCSSSGSGGSGSGGSGGAPDFAALKTTLTTPTGTLQPGGEGNVAAGFGKQSSASVDGSPFGGSSTSPKAIRDGELALESVNSLGGFDSCPGLSKGGTGTCACPGGGSIDYNIPTGGFSSLGGKSMGPVDFTLGLTANNCVDDKSASINGKFYMNAKSTKADNTDLILIESIHLAVTGGAKPGKYDVDLLLDLSSTPQRIVFAVDVPDGKVLVSGSWDAGTKTGSLTIKDKTGTFTCTAMNGVGSCKGADGKLRDAIKF